MYFWLDDHRQLCDCKADAAILADTCKQQHGCRLVVQVYSSVASSLPFNHTPWQVTDHGTNYTQHADRYSKHVHGASMSTNVHHAWALAVQANALRIMLRDRSVRVLYICILITCKYKLWLYFVW